jgi:PAS domain S-box-containing protein
MVKNKQKLETITILVIEDNPGDARLIKEYLKTDTSANYSITITNTLAGSLKTLSGKKFDVVLVDLGLPDSQGIYTFHEIINASPGSPVVIITGTDNENIGIEAIQGGAQNYLVKNQINPTLLVRTIKYAIEIKRKNTELKESRQKYRSIFEGAASLILSVNPTGNIIDCNNRIQQLLGYDKDEVIGKPIKKIIHPDSYEKVKKSLEEVFKKGNLHAGEYKMTRKDGEVVFVNIHSSALEDENNRNVLVSCIIDDITQRILEEKKQLLTTKILAILNRSNEWHNLIYDILFEIRKYSGIQAIGIRCKEGEDYPYFDAIGFPDSFIRKENFLCARNKKGELIYDADGMPFLECMCGNIISKRTDSFLSYFTEAGSFWTNSTTNLLAAITKKDLQTHTRNYCNAAGYESVALIPLISENETMGLLQLNDKRKNMFSEDMIHLFENIGLTLGIAFKRIKTEKLIIGSEEKYRRLFESARDGILILDADTGQILDANPYISEKTGYSHAALTSKKIWEIGFFKNIVANHDKFSELQQKEYLHYEDLPFEMADGQQINVEFFSNLCLVDNVRVIQCNIRDISARKCTEKALQALNLRQKAILLAVPDIIMEVDSNKVYTWTNKAGLEFFGEDVIGKEAQYYFEGEQNTYDKVHPIFTGDENIIYIESWQRRKDGQKRLLAWWCRVLKDEKGKVTGALSTARDITERKQEKELLLESEEKYRNVVERANDGICIIQDTKVKYTNARLAEMWGGTVEEVTGTSFTDYIHPDELAKVTDRYRRRLAGDDIKPVYETLLKSKDGRQVIAELNTGVITYQGKPADLVIVRDITERKQSEQKIQQSEMQYRSLTENSPDLIARFDQQYRHLYVNQAAANVGRYTPEEYIGKTMIEVGVPEQEATKWEKRIKIVFETGQTVDIEDSFETPNGLQWFNTKLVPEFAPDGSIHSVQSVARDITEHKQMEQSLQATKDHLDSLIKASPTVIYTCKVYNAFAATFVSENILSVFGYTSQEFLSYPGFWADHIHPEDKERVFSGLVDILDKRSHMHEYRFRIKNDSYLWVHDELTVAYDNNMNPAELRGYMTDINKRKMAEESLEQEQYLMHTLMNNVPDNIYFKDLVSRFIRISKALAQMFGLNDPSEAEGKTDFDFFTEEHAHQAYKDELEIIRTGQPISKEEKETWADRPDTWVLTTKLPMYNKEEKIVGTFGISVDITERKQAEILLRGKNLEIEAQNKEYQQLNEELLQTNEELQQAKEKAEESDRLKTSFLHNISHEIRTPLNGIIGFTDIITNPNLSHEKKEQFSRIIRDSSYQLLSIVDDIISIAAIEAGHEKPCPRESDINRLLELIKNQNYLSAEAKNLSFTVSSDLSDDKAVVMVDETKLLQILTNLVNNAIKFTLKGHIEVKCSLDSNYLKFTVKDTGIGIPEEMHDKIFDRFFQIDHNDTRLYGGTGLGLSIVKSYVHFLNGEIQIDSKPEKGTVFIISIPYYPVKQLKPVNIPVHDDGKQIGPATILIAEDETSNYELLSAYLSDFDLTIIHATDGLQAVEACKDNPSISLVLMDVKMPRMDGYEAARQIKKFRPQLPVIIQSAYVFQDKRGKSISSYFDGFIEKPINRDVLLENLYKHL